MTTKHKPLRWFANSRASIQSLLPSVAREIGFRLRRLQVGADRDDPCIKAFGEDDRIKHLIKISTDGKDGNTYRTAVATEFEEGLWVLDVFEKRSTHGISTPKPDIDRIAQRLGRLKQFRDTPEGKQIIDGMKKEAGTASPKAAPNTKVRPK